MFLLEWYREFLEIRAEFKHKKVELSKEIKEPEICQSCEVLKELLIQSNAEKMRILDKALREPTKETVVENPPPMIQVPKTLPWNIRRQMLEKEDRHKAQLLKDAPKPTDAELKEFEAELKDAEQRRETQKSS